MEYKDYPKMSEYIARNKRKEMREKFMKKLTVDEFLELFEDPDKVNIASWVKFSNTLKFSNVNGNFSKTKL